MANFNLNKVILGGRLTSDPELRQTTSGVFVTQFSIAVNRKYAPNGQQETDFLDIVAWRNTAEFVCKHFRKGSSICVVGSLQKRAWMDNQNNKRYATEVIADEAYFVDSKGEINAPTEKPSAEVYSTENVEFEQIADDQDLPF